ncbi:hypothetical protein AMTRI_Chr10g5770 [Amborella trichopoda]|uniref:RING-type E3 ubiquitin transferase n=1 Tax=Amborella trichopoda TaxID=13333 RepID=W1NW90_AMBTC|nr:U-box domain-containing protein 40 [Amborella trichopoda]ERM99593.1 hypothetical protein AMTR_s00088p00141580 [Amborella trichopoda]|eukprot:XP_006836740.1 U-box domain-containing protein 40 [Amborella trichopoda]
MGSRKARWTISLRFRPLKFGRQWPSEFLCPISMAPMADPVIVSSGQTFERRCIEAYKEMGAMAMTSTQLDVSALIPNLALKTAISNWCDEWGLKKPSTPDPKTSKELVQAFVALQRSPKNGTKVFEGKPEEINDETQVAEENLNPKDETKVAEDEKPSPNFGTRYATEKKPGFDQETRVGIQEKPSLTDEIRAKTDGTLCPEYKNDVGEEVKRGEHKDQTRVAVEKPEEERDETRTSEKKPVEEKMEDEKRVAEEKPLEEEMEDEKILKGVQEKPPIKFSYAATEVGRRNRHLHSSSSESMAMATPLQLSTKPTCYSSSSSSISSEAMDEVGGLPEVLDTLIRGLRHPRVIDQEAAVAELRQISRNGSHDCRLSLCTSSMLVALRTLLTSRNTRVQVDAIATLVNLSLERENKVRIVRSGVVPPLVDVLKAGCPEAQDHAAGALFSLSLVDDNKTAIGVLGAVPPLVHLLLSDGNARRGRLDAAMALYHLMLVRSNVGRLVRSGAMSRMLTLTCTCSDPELTERALLILCNVAATSDGRTAMLDADAVSALAGLMGRSSVQVVQEHCVGVLYLLSRNELRFKGAAVANGVAERLAEAIEKGGERAREKAGRLLNMMKGWSEDDDDDACSESVIPGRRRRLKMVLLSGPNSTEF